MNIEHLNSADQYQPGHIVRVVRDLLLEAGNGAPLADLLEKAWQAGYGARQDEIIATLRRREPSEAVQAEARSILQHAGLDRFDRAAYVAWEWNDEAFAWCPENDDCTIRPGEDGIIVMEAGGEYAGMVIARNGTISRFGEGTFLAP
jgi:hypothetical protein